MIPLRNLRRFLRKAAEQPWYAARVACHRLRAYRRYAGSDGIAPLPESITLFLTHRCNLRCRMCGQWGDKGITRAQGTGVPRAELTPAELAALIDDLASFKPNITLFGGEPFLAPDILNLIRRIKGHGMHCLVITNGSLLKQMADEIPSTGLDELNISLDGDAATHDAIRGMQGLFQRIADGIAAVGRAKERLHLRKPLVNLQCTINQDNYTRLTEMFDVAARLKADSLTFHHLIFLTESICESQDRRLAELLPGTSSENWRGFIFEPNIDATLLAAEITALKNRRPPFFVNFYPNLTPEEIREYYRDPATVPAGYRRRCVSPWMAGYVFPDGSVRPCLNLNYSFGSVTNGGFAARWNSDAAKKFRISLRGDGIFPACTRCTELFRY